MTADEIRNWPITDAGLAMHEPHRVAIHSAEFLRELAAQVAESNESRKPRWVEIEDVDGNPMMVNVDTISSLRQYNGRTIINNVYRESEMVGLPYNTVLVRLGITKAV